MNAAYHPDVPALLPVMTMNAFLRLDGVPGESTHAQFAAEIDVLDWSWGMDAGAASVGGGAGVGRVTLRDLVFVHAYDQASPVLAATCLRGRHVRDARLSVVQPGEAPYVLLRATLRDVTVGALDVVADPGADRPLETVTLRFGAATIEYVRQQPDGSAGTPVVVDWDGRR